MNEERQFRRRGLGRGLDALLSSATAEVEPDDTHLVMVDPREVAPNPEQPRRAFDEEALDALGESIRLHGLLHPIVVQRGEGGYTLVAGERRLRAAQRAGVNSIPALVRPAAESERQALELALTENLLRTDLSPLEEAAAYARLADTFGLSHEAIGLRVGRSRPAVANAIRLLGLSAPVQEALAEGRISAGHGRALLALSPQQQEYMLAKLERHGWSVRQLEAQINAYLAPPKGPVIDEWAAAGWGQRARERAGETEPDAEALRRGFESALGMPVSIERLRRGGGRLIIEFSNDSDLDELYRRLGGAAL